MGTSCCPISVRRLVPAMQLSNDAAGRRHPFRELLKSRVLSGGLLVPLLASTIGSVFRLTDEPVASDVGSERFHDCGP